MLNRKTEHWSFLSQKVSNFRKFLCPRPFLVCFIGSYNAYEFRAAFRPKFRPKQSKKSSVILSQYPLFSPDENFRSSETGVLDDYATRLTNVLPRTLRFRQNYSDYYKNESVCVMEDIVHSSNGCFF